MENKRFLTAQDVMDMLDVSLSYAYKLIRRLNAELVEQIKEKQGVTEQLKAENQMLWVGKMNNIIACAEKIVVREVVYV